MGRPQLHRRDVAAVDNTSVDPDDRREHVTMRPVLLLGWRGEPPGPVAANATRRELEAVDRTALNAADLVLIGDRALDADPPPSVVGHLAVAAIECWLCPVASSYGGVVAWASTQVGPVVEACEFVPRVIDALRRRASTATDLRDWLGVTLPTEPEPWLIGMLVSVPRLVPITVEALAMAVGISRRELVRRCGRDLGVTPHEILARFQIARARALRQQGMALECVARAVGLSGARALRRILAARGESLAGMSCPKCPPDCPNGPLVERDEAPHAPRVLTSNRTVAVPPARQGGRR